MKTFLATVFVAYWLGIVLGRLWQYVIDRKENADGTD